MDQLIKGHGDIAAWVGEQRGALSIAVAFWGTGAIEHLKLADYDGQLRILLDLSAGASNPAEVEALMKLSNCQVRKVDRMHAKAWISPTSLLIGSANASANGLGMEGSESSHWQELGVSISEPALVRDTQDWFNQLWDRESSDIFKEDLRVALKNWKLRRRFRPSSSGKETLLSAILECPENFLDRKIYVVVVNKDLSKKAKEKVGSLSKLAKHQIYAYENWPTIPKEATLLAFTYYNEVLAFDEPDIYDTEQRKTPGKLQFVYAKRDILSHRLGPLAAWRERFDVLKAKHPKKWNFVTSLSSSRSSFI